MPVKRILIVDDETKMLEAIEKKLTADGFEVLLAATGQEADERILQYPPDLILMDIVLPDMEGSDIVKRLQNDPAFRTIPIIFLSGIISRENGRRWSTVKVGGWEYRALAKPFSYRELRDLIDDIFKTSDYVSRNSS